MAGKRKGGAGSPYIRGKRLLPTPLAATQLIHGLATAQCPKLPRGGGYAACHARLYVSRDDTAFQACVMPAPYLLVTECLRAAMLSLL